MINSNKYNLQMAPQTARGVYPAVPTYFFKCPGVGLVPKPTISKLNVNDGRLWSPASKRVTYIESGGTPDLYAQPNGLGACLYGMMGAVTSTPGAPDSHVITPATDLSAFPWWYIWQYFDGRWMAFPDCQFVGGQFTVSNSNTWAVIKPNILGMAVPKYVAAPASEATEEDEDIHWLDGGGYHFIGGDYANALHIAAATDLDSVKTSLASFKTAWNLHCAVASGLHHKAADAVNTLSYATPIADEAAAVAACTEIRTDVLAHYADTATHYFADVLNVIAHANPTDTDTCITFLQELIGAVNSPGCYNRHLGGRAGAQSLTVNIDMQATPIQGEAVVPYCIHRKPSAITCAMDLYLEDWELINLALFGDPNPAAETELTTEIQQLSMYNKFITQTAPEEWSVAFLIPQFDLDPESLYSIGPSPDGNEIIGTIGGECSGTDPALTATVLNSVAAL